MYKRAGMFQQVPPQIRASVQGWNAGTGLLQLIRNSRCEVTRGTGGTVVCLGWYHSLVFLPLRHQ